MVKSIIAGLLILCCLGKDRTVPLDFMEEQWRGLLARYQEDTADTTLQKIHEVEEGIIRYIAESGFEVTIKAEQQEELVVRDTANYNHIIARLSNGDRIKIYERHYNNTFIILTADGTRGYLLHDKFEPALTSFPLKVLVAKTAALPPKMPDQAVNQMFNSTRMVKEKKVVQEKEKIKVHPEKSANKEKKAPVTRAVMPSSTCSTVRCTGRTQKQQRCKNNTSSCDKRCRHHHDQ